MLDQQDVNLPDDGGGPPTPITGPGKPKGVIGLTGSVRSVYFLGIGVGTYQVQASVDGVTWVNQGAAQTADGTPVDITLNGVQMVRVDVQVYTSGNPRAVLTAA